LGLEAQAKLEQTAFCPSSGQAEQQQYKAFIAPAATLQMRRILDKYLYNAKAKWLKVALPDLDKQSNATSAGSSSPHKMACTTADMLIPQAVKC
jgi:hypothetical protein